MKLVLTSNNRKWDLFKKTSYRIFKWLISNWCFSFNWCFSSKCFSFLKFEEIFNNKLKYKIKTFLRNQDLLQYLTKVYSASAHSLQNSAASQYWTAAYHKKSNLYHTSFSIYERHWSWPIGRPRVGKEGCCSRN